MWPELKLPFLLLALLRAPAARVAWTKLFWPLFTPVMTDYCLYTLVSCCDARHGFLRPAINASRQLRLLVEDQ